MSVMTGLRDRAPDGGKKPSFVASLRLRRFGAGFGLLLLGAVFALASPHFLQVNNLTNVAMQTAVIAIIAIGQTYVIVTAGIDLSVGAIAALAGVVAAEVMLRDVGVPLAIVAGLLTGLACGAVNGVVIAYGNVPPFIATLGMLGIARGIVLVVTDGIPLAGLPREFGTLGSGRLLGIPFVVIIMLLLMFVFGRVLQSSRFGKGLYALGSNEVAAYLSGLHTSRLKVQVYALSGLLAAVGGILLTSRLVSAAPTAGEGYELDAIAATVIGGASLAGGTGTIGGTLIGAFVMGVLRNGLNLLGVSYYWQQIAIGIVIIGAVYLDMLRRRRA